MVIREQCDIGVRHLERNDSNHVGHIGTDIPLGQHDDLGLRRGSGSENQHGYRIRIDLHMIHGHISLSNQFLSLFQQRGDRLQVLLFVHRECELNGCLSGKNRFFGLLLLFLVEENYLSLAPLQGLFELSILQFLIQRYGYASANLRCRVHHEPVIAVFAGNGNSLAAESPGNKSGRQRFHFFVESNKADVRITVFPLLQGKSSSASELLDRPYQQFFKSLHLSSHCFFQISVCCNNCNH